MALEIILLVVGLVLLIVGFVGCILPGLPGPIVAYAALIVLSIPGGFALYAPVTLVVLAVVVAGVSILDSVLPVTATRKAGGGRAGVWGSILGMIVGTIFFPPFGVIVGAFVGALVLEAVFNRSNPNPLRAALGVLRGTLLATLLKLAVTGVVAFYYVRGAVNLLG